MVLVKMGYFLVRTLISRFQNSGLILVADVVYEERIDVFMDKITLVYHRTESLQLIEIVNYHRVESILELNVHFIIDFYCLANTLSMIWP